MSTLPYNLSDAVKTDQPATILTAAGPDLDAAVRHFAATADALAAPRPSLEELHGWIRQVADITRELFPGKLVVETGVDPEIRDDVSLLIHVEASVSIEEVMALDERWHLAVIPISPKWPGLFCLLVQAR